MLPQSKLLGCRFYIPIRAIVNDVVMAPSFFFSSQFCYFFTHISERSIVNTLNDARSNLLFDETMSSPPVSYGNPPPHSFSVFKPSVGYRYLSAVHKTLRANDVIKFKMPPRGKLKLSYRKKDINIQFFSTRKSFILTRKKRIGI